MKQNYIVYFMTISTIFHTVYSMENEWEQKAQNIKNLYNQASALESNGNKNEALKIYCQIIREYFPQTSATEKFKEIFKIKEKATTKVQKLSKEKETIDKKTEDTDDIWPLALFVAKVTKFGK